MMQRTLGRLTPCQIPQLQSVEYTYSKVPFGLQKEAVLSTSFLPVMSVKQQVSSFHLTFFSVSFPTSQASNEGCWTLQQMSLVVNKGVVLHQALETHYDLID